MKDAKLFLDPPIVKVTLDPGVWVDPAKMMEAIRNSGFTPVPEDVHLTVTGTLKEVQGSFVLALDEMKEPKNVNCTVGEGNTAQELPLAATEARVVEVQGRWLSDDHGRLLVESVARGNEDDGKQPASQPSKP